MKKWEYLIVTDKYEDKHLNYEDKQWNYKDKQWKSYFKGSNGRKFSSREEMLDKLGEEGWEMVNFGIDEVGCEYYAFKRERR